eukprot:7892782-Pyramimonas_sp.AAC.1
MVANTYLSDGEAWRLSDRVANPMDGFIATHARALLLGRALPSIIIAKAVSPTAKLLATTKFDDD